MNFNARNSKKISIIAIILFFILLVSLVIKNIDNIKAYSNDYKNIQSLVNLCIEDRIQELSEEEKNKAKLYIDETINKRYSNRDLLGKSHFILGAIYYSESNYELSIDEYDKASKYFEKVNNNKMKLRSYYYISKCYEYNEQYLSGDIAFDKLKNEAKTKEELELLVEYSFERANDISANSENWYRLIVLLEDLIPIAEDIKYYKLERVYFRLGNAYEYYEDYINGRKFKLKALDIAESNERIENIYKISINIAVDYMNSYQYEEAIKYLEKSLEYDIEDKNENLHQKSNALVNLARSYVQLDKYEDAQRTLDNLDLVIEQIEDELHKGSLEITKNITKADLYIRMGETDEAFKLLEFTDNKFKNEFDEIKKPTFKNLDKSILREYGNLYYNTGEYEKALEYYIKEKNIIQERELFYLEQDCNYKIYLVYKAMGNYPEALKYLERNNEINNNTSEERNKKYSKYLVDEIEKNKKTEEINNLKLHKNKLIITVGILILLISFIIIYTINISKKNKEINRLNVLFKDLSSTDSLTKLQNRRALDDYLAGNWALYKETHVPITFVMLDVDYFKKYNDNYGHQEGDKALQQVAAIIKECCRSTDFIARYGGEEFTIIMVQTDKCRAINVIERIQSKIYDLNIKHGYSEVSDRITISFGISTAHVGTKKDYNDYLKKADEALYISKERGRNTYTYMS